MLGVTAQGGKFAFRSSKLKKSAKEIPQKQLILANTVHWLNHCSPWLLNMSAHNLVEILGGSEWILRIFDHSCMDTVSYSSSLVFILGSYANQFTFQKGLYSLITNIVLNFLVLSVLS